MTTKLLSASAIVLLMGVATPAFADCSRVLQPDEVVFYHDANCENTAFRLKAGDKSHRLSEHKTSDGKTHDYNDDLSSVGVGANMTVTLYQDKDYGGDKVTLYPGGHPHLEQYGDAVSSVKVENFDGGKLVSLFKKNGNMSDHPTQTVQYLAPGKYNFGDSQNELLLDDDAESIYVPAGLEAVLWTKWKGEGKSVTLKGGADGAQIDLANEGVANNVQSIEVRKSGYKLVKAVVSDLRADPAKSAEAVRTGQTAQCVAAQTGALKCKGELKYSEAQSVEASTTDSLSATESLTVTETSEVSVEGVGSQSLEVSVGLAVEEAHSDTDTKGTTKTQEISVGYEVDPEPGTTLDVQLSAEMQPMIGDITYHYENVHDSSDTYTTKGTLSYDNYSTARIVVTDENENEVAHDADERTSTKSSEKPAADPSADSVSAYDGYMSIVSAMATAEDKVVHPFIDDGNHEFHLLDGGHSLVEGKMHVSRSGNHYLIFNEGNLFVRDEDGKMVWGLRDQISRPGHIGKIVYQNDGNLAAYDSNGGYMWSALHEASPAGTELHLNDKGVLQIRHPDGTIAWSSAE